MNPFYFIWTKLLIGVIFGILFTFVYEKLPLVKKISSTLQGIKYVFIFWIVISLWNLSHPIIYESINYKNQNFGYCILYVDFLVLVLLSVCCIKNKLLINKG